MRDSRAVRLASVGGGTLTFIMVCLARAQQRGRNPNKNVAHMARLHAVDYWQSQRRGLPRLLM